MRTFPLHFLFISFLYLFGCKNSNQSNIIQEKKLLSPNLIKECIDSTRVLDSAINTKTFCIDVHLLRQTESTALSHFLNNYKTIKPVNLDSLERVKSNWLENEFKQNDVIRFEKIEKKTDSLVINITNNRYIIAGFSSEIIFKQNSSGYKCLSNKITAIY